MRELIPSIEIAANMKREAERAFLSVVSSDLFREIVKTRPKTGPEYEEKLSQLFPILAGIARVTFDAEQLVQIMGCVKGSGTPSLIIKNMPQRKNHPTPLFQDSMLIDTREDFLLLEDLMVLGISYLARLEPGSVLERLNKKPKIRIEDSVMDGTQHSGISMFGFPLAALGEVIKQFLFVRETRLHADGSGIRFLNAINGREGAVSGITFLDDALALLDEEKKGVLLQSKFIDIRWPSNKPLPPQPVLQINEATESGYSFCAGENFNVLDAFEAVASDRKAEGALKSLQKALRHVERQPHALMDGECLIFDETRCLHSITARYTEKDPEHARWLRISTFYRPDDSPGRSV